MKRIAVAVASLALGAGAGTAHAAPSPQAQIAKLNAEVSALQKSVKTLQADLKKQTTELTNTINVFSAIDACQTAVVADAFQGTWAIVDQLEVAAGKPAVWGPQAAVNDFSACSIVSNNTVTHGISTPANVTAFSALITLLHG